MASSEACNWCGPFAVMHGRGLFGRQMGARAWQGLGIPHSPSAHFCLISLYLSSLWMEFGALFTWTTTAATTAWWSRSQKKCRRARENAKSFTQVALVTTPTSASVGVIPASILQKRNGDPRGDPCPKPHSLKVTWRSEPGFVWLYDLCLLFLIADPEKIAGLF